MPAVAGEEWSLSSHIPGPTATERFETALAGTTAHEYTLKINNHAAVTPATWGDKFDQEFTVLRSPSSSDCSEFTVADLQTLYLPTDPGSNDCDDFTVYLFDQSSFDYDVTTIIVNEGSSPPSYGTWEDIDAGYFRDESISFNWYHGGPVYLAFQPGSDCITEEVFQLKDPFICDATNTGNSSSLCMCVAGCVHRYD